MESQSTSKVWLKPNELPQDEEQRVVSCLQGIRGIIPAVPSLRDFTLLRGCLESIF